VNIEKRSGVSPQAVAYGFATSREREGNRVRLDYQTFLGRTPSQSEVDAWVNQFAHGPSTPPPRAKAKKRLGPERRPRRAGAQPQPCSTPERHAPV